jgi:RNA 2',3'-cyclic 3'-phosphodiesterase
MRLFIALDLPDAWKTALTTLQDDMRTALHQRFGDTVRPRWVRPEGIHLTLKFLSETPEDRLAALGTALAAAVPQAPGFSLTLGRAGSFSDRRAPRVILATVVDQQNALLPLFERIETRLAAAGWPRGKRAFHPHLTLARLPDSLDDATRRAIAEVTTGIAPALTPPWNVDRVYLIQSHFGPSSGGPGASPGVDTRARYERLAAFPA